MTEELKLKVGQCYETRDGRKAFVSVTEDTTAYGCVIGNCGVFIWYINGLWQIDDTTKNDIVGKWNKECE